MLSLISFHCSPTFLSASHLRIIIYALGLLPCWDPLFPQQSQNSSQWGNQIRSMLLQRLWFLRPFVTTLNTLHDLHLTLNHTQTFPKDQACFLCIQLANASLSQSVYHYHPLCQDVYLTAHGSILISILNTTSTNQASVTWTSTHLFGLFPFCVFFLILVTTYDESTYFLIYLLSANSIIMLWVLQ